MCHINVANHAGVVGTNAAAVATAAAAAVSAAAVLSATAVLSPAAAAAAAATVADQALLPQQTAAAAAVAAISPTALDLRNLPPVVRDRHLNHLDPNYLMTQNDMSPFPMPTGGACRPIHHLDPPMGASVTPQPNSHRVIARDGQFFALADQGTGEVLFLSHNFHALCGSENFPKLLSVFPKLSSVVLFSRGSIK